VNFVLASETCTNRNQELRQEHDGYHNNNWLNRRRFHNNSAFPAVNQSLENEINQRHLRHVFAVLRRRFTLVCLRSLPKRFADYDCERSGFYSGDCNSNT
jgi:hypothetical protein